MPSWKGLLALGASAPGATLSMIRWPAGALRRYAAARSDENIDYMVTRGRLECRERRTSRAGVDGHGGQPAADLLPRMRRTVQIAPRHLLANAPGSIRSRSPGRPSVCQAAIRVALISRRRCVMSVCRPLGRGNASRLTWEVRVKRFSRALAKPRWLFRYPRSEPVSTNWLFPCQIKLTFGCRS